MTMTLNPHMELIDNLWLPTKQIMKGPNTNLNYRFNHSIRGQNVNVELWKKDQQGQWKQITSVIKSKNDLRRRSWIKSWSPEGLIIKPSK